ncbi:hypothetical protein [Bradyrhizobium sp. USDA 4529]
MVTTDPFVDCASRPVALEPSFFIALRLASAVSVLPSPARLPAFGRKFAKFTLAADGAAAVAEAAAAVSCPAADVFDAAADVAAACAVAIAAATACAFVGSEAGGMSLNTTAVRIKVTLKGVRPEVMRCLVVPLTLRLDP